MKPKTNIIKFQQVSEQTQGPVKRIVGFVHARHMLGLFDAADLAANPRSAKSGTVTDDILESIEGSPVLFPFKTKGVLVGASDYKSLERNRYELRFGDPEVEGVLDGGHNMLAIGTAILAHVIDDEKVLRRIKRWDDLKEAWHKYRDQIEVIKDDLGFLVPLEIIVPSDLQSDSVLEEFRTSLLEICAARNNNVQLTLETKANKKGFYDEIRKTLPTQVADRIEWKTNDGGEIKVRDIIALAWIPFSKLREAGLLPGKVSVSPQNIYRNKGECTKAFDRVMSDPAVSKPREGYTQELHSRPVKSAIAILGKLPELYDQIYADFPDAYNASGGKFGRITIVKMFEPGRSPGKKTTRARTQPRTHFTKSPVKYRYPDGIIMPLVYGLRALMTIREGELIWSTDPSQFLRENLADIADAYRLVLEMSQYDPQKIGKNETSYKIAQNEFERARAMAEPVLV